MKDPRILNTVLKEKNSEDRHYPPSVLNSKATVRKTVRSWSRADRQIRDPGKRVESPDTDPHELSCQQSGAEAIQWSKQSLCDKWS